MNYPALCKISNTKMTEGNRANILVADGLAEAGLNLLQEYGNVTNNSNISSEELGNMLGRFEALIVRSRTKVSNKLLEASGNLRVVGRAGVGVDNIDIRACQSKGILVVNSPLAASAAVAELTIGLILSLARDIPNADVSMKIGAWEKKRFVGSEVGGKTLGLLGFGRIGVETAKRARGLFMKTKAHDPALTDDEIRDRGADPATLEQLLSESDYLSIHTPLTDQTRGLMGRDQLFKMKPGARLICTARGKIVDEMALREVLDAGHLAGAALDVFANEPTEEGGIATSSRVIATPHIGAQTREAQTRAGMDIAEEVIRALKEEPLRWQIKSC